ncbi:NANOG neighbor homeobox [Lemmus lemmus]
MSPKKPVSKSLMDTLWAKFKLRKSPKVRDCFSLSFEFSLTDKQIYHWFHEKKKKYKEEMVKQKNSRNRRSEVLQTCCADLREEDVADLRDKDVEGMNS